jgi:redox-sensitive bicupin YhaK (pirin superfamily)
MAIEILHRDDLPLGGFAGLKEHRLVMSPKIFGPHANPDTWSGIGRFVYCADARFNPHGETRMHDHKEIDVISVMIEGRIDHQGSLEHGQALAANDVQVQRAGGEGFSHNEVNPDDSTNRMIQLWVLPEQAGEPAAYKLYRLPPGKLTRVYGGSNDQSDTFPSHTVIEVALFDPSEELVIDKPFLAYLAVGEATANSIEMAEGTLFKGDRLTFQGQSNGKLIVIYEI